MKVLCTTVGESAADFLNANLGFGLTGVSLVTGAREPATHCGSPRSRPTLQPPLPDSTARRSATWHRFAPSPRTPWPSSTPATKPAPPAASTTWKPVGTTPKPASNPGTTPPGPPSTARSTPCCANCARRARTRPPKSPPSPCCSPRSGEPSTERGELTGSSAVRVQDHAAGPLPAPGLVNRV
ncbi:hypothetical protein [Amycolatopsis rhabdoformis]|uniref:hypothetical protein n=1 Tax=Amycolatopsis rhabdoformis TaxID=1448059 RepID=UPI0038992F0D